MDRRRFIEAGAALLTLTAGDIAFAAARPDEKIAPHGGPTPAQPAAAFALGYHSGLHGGYWIDAMSRPAEAVPAQVKVYLLGVQASSYPIGSNPLTRFDVDMMFRLRAPTGTLASYRWATLTRNGGLSTSKPITHTLAPDQIAGLNVTYDSVTDGKGKRTTVTLPWTSAAAPALTPGFYAIVGPSVGTGLPPSWAELAPPVSTRCLVGRCDGRTNAFDALLIAVEPALEA